MLSLLSTMLDRISDQATASQAINKRESKLDASGKNKTYDVRLENFDLAFGERWVVFTFYLFIYLLIIMKKKTKTNGDIKAWE